MDRMKHYMPKTVGELRQLLAKCPDNAFVFPFICNEYPDVTVDDFDMDKYYDDIDNVVDAKIVVDVAGVKETPPSINIWVKPDEGKWSNSNGKDND